MEALGKRLRARARELGLSDAEVARRTGLDIRRYGHYVGGRREPDFSTFLRICGVLAATPNELLGITEGSRAEDPMVSRLLTEARELRPAGLRLLVSIAKTVRQEEKAPRAASLLLASRKRGKVP